MKVEGWAGIDAAHKEITEGIANFKKAMRDGEKKAEEGDEKKDEKK